MKYIYLHIFISFFTLSSFAQQDSLKVNYDSSVIEQRKFDTEQLEKYNADTDFNYEVKKQEPSALERLLSWLQRKLLRVLEWIFGNEAAQGIFAILVRIIPYLSAAIVLFLILKFFLKVNFSNLISGKTKKTVVTLTEDEELIKNEDLSKLIKKAIHQQNYRLAVRYYYLFTLQKLSNNELIDWQQQKTNEDYIKEIKTTQLKDKFIRSTHLYDFVWYGNFDINELEFVKAEKVFKELSKLIK